MVDQVTEMFVEAVSQILTEYPTHIEFPLGGNIEIPLPVEEQLASVIAEMHPANSDHIAAIRDELSRRQAYSLVTFAVRMSVSAVRTNSAPTLHCALLGLVLDDCLVDWRDILIALSIIEECAVRLGVDFANCMASIRDVAVDDRVTTIFDGYLSRPKEMRSVDVMNFQVEGAGETLTFCRRK
jgi:hypothetical protein